MRDPGHRHQAEFDEFYSATSRRIVGHLYLMTGNLPEAEDSVAEAFLKAWNQWPQVRDADSPEAWVRRVASRNAVSAWRKAVNRLRAHDHATPDLVVDDLGPDHVALVEALRRISPDQRRAIVLHHLVGLTVEEVAREVGSPSGTVKARLARGRTAMAPHLADTRPDLTDSGRSHDA
jgi:RNA polymerase sigma-70 factor (sigma-E family)